MCGILGIYNLDGKAVDEKIVNLDAQKKHVHNKRKTSNSGILGWIGSLYNKFRGKK